MKFDTIFIANLAEIAEPLLKHMTPVQRAIEIYEDHVYCDRFVCSDDDDRILVTPLPIDPVFFADMNKLMGFHNVVNYWPEKIDASICEAILNEKWMRERLVTVIKRNPGIKITSYAATAPFKKLLSYLKKRKLSFSAPEMPEASDLWTASFFDSKAGFRQAMSSLDVEHPDMPRGFVTTSPTEVIGWSEYLLRREGGFVMKTNRGLAGAGIKIVKQGDMKIQDVEGFIRQVMHDEPYWQRDDTVIEEYVTPNTKVGARDLSIEFKVDNRGVTYLYPCGMRIATGGGVFKGVEFGRGAVDRKLAAVMEKTGKEFGGILYDNGYRGFFDMDWVYGGAHKMFPIEANLRRTGGTHAYELAKQLLGKDFLNDYYVASQMKTEAPRYAGKKYARLKKELGHLFFPINGVKEGVVPVMTNYLAKGQIGYVVIGRNKQRVAHIEAELLAGLE
ncbi:MAG TPA: hypothetical protein PKL83_00635 [bacterium]|nr:hypothetical protein [bacterium]